MHEQNYQEILARVQAPTRYTGNEINSIKKNRDTVKASIGLVFPDLYEIGTSHFGLQILYAVLNAQQDIAAERFFAPAPDMEALMRKKAIPCLSMESRQPLADFDIIGFSLLYELNFTNILTMLDLSGIPFYAEDRSEALPLVIGGGPCAFNPEPLADFFDAFVIGDGEQASVEIAQAVAAFKAQGDGRKRTLLRIMSQIPGVYVPSFFNVSYDADGFQQTRPLLDDYRNIRRAVLPELTREQFPVSPVLPFGKPVHDRLRLEIARGCSRGCRFCQAGMIYRPVRERPLEDLIRITDASLKATGYADISLLSLSTGDYSQLPELMAGIMALEPGHCNSVSLPSVRAEKLTPQLMHIIRQVRKTGFTIAPEAGSQRLRDIINKNLTRDSIETTVQNAMALGWKNIKLYFMIGLPFETGEDVAAICDMSKHLASQYAKGKKAINVSVTSFIPKAHTPFQWSRQISLAESLEKLQYLKTTLRHPKVNLKWQDPQMSQLEGVWARGDRKLSKLLVAAFENGCRLDGWSDHFDMRLWEKAFEQSGIDPSFYTTRPRTLEENLPWSHIDAGISVKFLKKEHEKAQQQVLTPDCREHDCTGCGICDFKTIAPVVHDSKAGQKQDLGLQKDDSPFEEQAFLRFELAFSKLGDAKYFGHLELATIFMRAIKRAGIKIKYSQGFNPSMRLSFETALPVGMESEQERCFAWFDRTLAPKTVQNLLNAQLPSGIEITGCRRYTGKRTAETGPTVYRLSFKKQMISKQAVLDFLNLETLIVEDVSKKGKIRRTDLRKSVERMAFIDVQTIEMILKPIGQRTVRPGEILKRAFALDEADLFEIAVRKMKQGTV